MKVAYIGTRMGTSGHRMNALSRIGHEVTHFDPRSYLPRHLAFELWMRHLGSIGLMRFVEISLAKELRHRQFDVAWVDHGELISNNCISTLRQHCEFILSYNADDPFGRRDSRLWHQYLLSVPGYDLLIVVRQINVSEAYSLGAKRVKRVFMAADEVAHAPVTRHHNKRPQSGPPEVLFVGTGFPERGPFVHELLKRRVPLSIYGDRWARLPEWKSLREVWRGSGVYDDRCYAELIGNAKVCLGLLSKGNRDLHTSRSMEIPSLGGLLCAERTVEHQYLYRENHEAMFWSDAHECADRCHQLLADDTLRRKVADAGHGRFKTSRWTNERVAEEILDELVNTTRRQPPESASLTRPCSRRKALG